MASNVTRDHHNLRRNLNLNDNYISNDGGDEGIRITDAGLVGIGVSDPDTTLEVAGTSKVTFTGTTTNALEIKATALTIGRALEIDVNDSLTASATKLLQIIDYDKSGVTADGQLSSTTGLSILMADSATNDALSNVAMLGININIDSANAQGSIFQKGINLNIASDEVGDAATTFGIDMTVMNGATDIQMRSSADAGDYCSIATTVNGATTIATVDDDGEAAHLTLAPDGDTIIDKNTALTTTGTVKGLHIDYDHTGISASGQTITGIGLDVDMNCESVTHVGTVNQTGIDIDMTAGSDGLQYNIGIDIASSGSDNATGLIIDVDGSGTIAGIQLDSKNGGKDFVNRSSANVGDYFILNTIADGATTLQTVDGSGTAAHLTIIADGHVEFDNCAVGFDKLAGIFGASPVIDDGTDIDFRLGNKYNLTLSADMESDDLLNLIFPAVTGNFILVLVHDPGGGYDIDDAAWKAYASDGSLADSTLSENGTDGEVRWAGGATPTLSANGRDIDIISIYWDADTQTALAVASLNFAAV